MREALGGKITMTTGLFGELRCYSDDSFEDYGNDLFNWCTNARQREVISEHVLSVALPGVECDPSGRLTIRDQFRDETAIGRDTDVVIVWRVEGWMEVWNRIQYELYRKDPGNYKGSLMGFLESLQLPTEPAAPAQPRTRRAGR
jgi:DNA-binding transcriptional regulator/RsmH inhibitor MraZ